MSRNRGYIKGWFGMLTIDNIEMVANKIHEVLAGKRYTFVAVGMYGNESRPGYLISRPEVRTGQSLSDGPKIYYGDDREFAGFHFGDTYGTWGCSTHASDAAFDPEFNNPYIVIEHNNVQITHRAPAGHVLYWVVAVEPENEATR